MWYLDGKFIPSSTPHGERFVATATALDLNISSKDHTQAIRVMLRDSPNDEGALFVVMSLSEGRLFGRYVVDQEAVQWAIANVPE